MMKPTTILCTALFASTAIAQDAVNDPAPFNEEKMTEIAQGDRDDYSPPDFSQPLSAYRLDEIAGGDRDE